jgi:hypothetical protein
MRTLLRPFSRQPSCSCSLRKRESSTKVVFSSGLKKIPQPSRKVNQHILLKMSVILPLDPYLVGTTLAELISGSYVAAAGEVAVKAQTTARRGCSRRRSGRGLHLAIKPACRVKFYIITAHQKQLPQGHLG